MDDVPPSIWLFSAAALSVIKVLYSKLFFRPPPRPLTLSALTKAYSGKAGNLICQAFDNEYSWSRAMGMSQVHL
jgi:hypothetical protein